MNSQRCYHYIMLPFSMQVSITMSAIIVILFQLIVYYIIQDHITEYDGECDVIINETGQAPVSLQCGEETITPTGDMQREILHYMLTNDAEPAINCSKQVEEYLHGVHWNCAINSNQNG